MDIALGAGQRQIAALGENVHTAVGALYLRCREGHRAVRDLLSADLVRRKLHLEILVQIELAVAELLGMRRCNYGNDLLARCDHRTVGIDSLTEYLVPFVLREGVYMMSDLEKMADAAGYKLVWSWEPLPEEA